MHIPLQNKSPEAIACATPNHIICPQTTFKALFSDNGTEFVSQVLDALCQHLQIKKFTVLPYRPRVNGLVKRHNCKIINFLRSLIYQTDNIWDTYIQQVMVSLNSNGN